MGHIQAALALALGDHKAQHTHPQIRVRPLSRLRVVKPYRPPWKTVIASAVGAVSDNNNNIREAECKPNSSAYSVDTVTQEPPTAPPPCLYPLKLRASAAPPRPSPTGLGPGRLTAPPSPSQETETSRVVPIGGRKAAELRAARALIKTDGEGCK